MKAKKKAKFTFSDKIESSDHEAKYGNELKKLAEIVGGVANEGDIAAFEFLIIYTTLIFNSGFEVLKSVIGEEKSRTFNDFLKKVGMLN